MIKLKTKLSPLFLVCLGLTSYAQKTVSASGGNATGSSGTVSYSIGQVAQMSLSGTNGLLIQGVQHPYEIQVVTSVESEAANSIALSAYPNPTSDFLNLKVEDYTSAATIYQLYNANGLLLESKAITSNETIITMKELFAANYLLKITQGNKEIKTFKIIKN